MAARKKSEEPSINVDEVLTDEELKAVADESEPAERKIKPEDGPRTVVVAEDEAVNRMDLVAMLEDNGYEVVGQAANGEEAVELTRKYRPDVVCMDVKMTRMDGIAAAGIICDENVAPVVMLTAFSQTDLVKKATGAGAMAYVTKPYEESKLLPTLEWPWAVSPRSTICWTTWSAANASSRKPPTSSRKPKRSSRRPKTRLRSASSLTALRVC